MLWLHEHFFDFVPGAEYFRSNHDIVNLTTHKKIIGLAFYHFNLDEMVGLIETARQKCAHLLVYIKEPFNLDLITLLKKFEVDSNIKFFGDAIMNANTAVSNWQPAISWFVSPRHYYQVDDWAKNLLAKVDHDYSCPRDYQFDCLLGIRRAHRDQIDNFYQHSNVKNHILYRYYRDNIHTGTWDMDIGDIRGTWESLQVFDHYQVALSALVPYYIYNQSYHSVVAETTDFNQFNHVTEKVAKPMMSKRIFVAFAGQYYLESLKSLGFQTFSDVLDESYDIESDHATRYRMAWQQIEWLCQQPAVDVKQRVQKVLDHNHAHFLKSDWHATVKNCLHAWMI